MTRFIIPGDVEGYLPPSGGNTYNLRMLGMLPLTEIIVAGNWPVPDPGHLAQLARVLDEIPDGEPVLIDGLVAGGHPDLVVPQADRLRIAVLVHLPLAAETGLTPAAAADLDARERRTLHAAHLVVATSPWARRRLIEQHGLPADRVHAVPPGTEPAPPAPGSTGAPRLLCVASVTPRKGQDLLAAALASLTDLPWTCECVGPVDRTPDFVERVRELIDRYGLAGRMTLPGPRTGDDLAAGYAEADLLVLPSRAETYGMVVTEALARAIPVVATAVDAVPDTLGRASDGSVPGILVPPGDVAALTGALRRFLTEPGLRDRLRASARGRVLEDWDTASARLGAVLDRLVQEPTCVA